jgi:outer membrane protein
MKHVVIAFLAVFILAPATAYGRILTEDEVVRTALERNPRIKAGAQAVRAARAVRWSALSDMLPTANVAYTGIRNDEEITFNPAAFDPTAIDSGSGQSAEIIVQPLDLRTLTFEVNQPLFAGGSLYQRWRMAALQKQMAEHDLAGTRTSVAFQAREAYYGAIQARGYLRIAQETLEQLRENKRVVERMYEVGMVPRNDLLRSEVALARGEQDLQRADDGVRLACVGLRVVMDLPSDTTVEVADTVGVPPFDKSLEECMQAAFGTRPDLLGAEKGLRVASKGVKAAAGSLLPRLGAAFQYERQSEETAFSGDKDTWRVVASASFDLPLALGNVARVEEARAKELQAREGVRGLRRAVELDVESAYSQLNVARKGLTFAQRQLASAQENYRLVQRRFQEGEATHLDLLDAQTQLTTAKANDLNTRADYRHALALLALAMGLEGAGL